MAHVIHRRDPPSNAGVAGTSRFEGLATDKSHHRYRMRQTLSRRLTVEHSTSVIRNAILIAGVTQEWGERRASPSHPPVGGTLGQRSFGAPAPRCALIAPRPPVGRRPAAGSGLRLPERALDPLCGWERGSTALMPGGVGPLRHGDGRLGLGRLQPSGQARSERAQRHHRPCCGAAVWGLGRERPDRHHPSSTRKRHLRCHGRTVGLPALGRRRQAA
jgi:hypothetical protein